MYDLKYVTIKDSMHYTILHNSRCSKSRAGLEILKASWVDFEERYYLENPLDLQELQDIQKKLNMRAIEFTRRGESDFKTAWLSKDSSDTDILQAILQYPKLLERPIVYTDISAVVWRPPENIKNFLG